MRKTLIAAAVLAASTSLAMAQTATPPKSQAPQDPFNFQTNDELHNHVIKPNTPLQLHVLSDHEDYLVEVVGRTTSGVPELHPHFIDYAIIQEGEGTLTWGGTNTTSRDTGGGELRGGTIVGGQTRDIKPGDYIQMPAGVWHQFTLKPGVTAFRYFVIKTRQ
jgi:mannose-6-phosphate isomerase-like protein (cupin superfamily)